MQDNTLFYKSLTKYSTTLVDLIGQENLFLPFPTDWQIIVVDVEKSTQAVKNGLHHQVNLTATGSIIAVLNHLKTLDKKIKIPYFFGGDGATFIVPPLLLDGVIEILENFRHYVRKNMYLSLKVGSLPVREIYEGGRNIKIARLTINPYLIIPVVLGTGLREAERLIKSLFIDETATPEVILPVNLEGMECRWQEIKSPHEGDKIVCLVINCPDDQIQSQTYHQVLQSITQIFGSYEERHPISTKKLRLDLTLKKMRKEMYARLGESNIFYLLKNWLITIIGSFYFDHFKGGKAYVQKVHELSYTVMVDGALNMVISGTLAEVNELIPILDDLEKKNKIRYGIHVTHASIMSCYVEDRKSKHIHFVDGTEGGYTSAAKMYKSKVA